jgi:microcystin-dependent protein
MSTLNFPTNPSVGDYYESDIGSIYQWNGYAWNLVTLSDYVTPPGVIAMWSGLFAGVPTGWSLCDGQDGRPDLRGRFILGAYDDSQIGQVGGSEDAVLIAHSHTANSTTTVNDPGHTHTYYHQQGGSPRVTGHQYLDADGTLNTGSSVTGITVSVSTTIESSGGGNGVGANMPPYYKLAFIIKD